MSQSSRLGDVLFWLMVLLGAAVLVPCLVLPAWLEYRASLDLKCLRKEQVERRRAEITKLRKQREHLQSDEAYVLRLAREHLNIEVPGVRRVHVEPGPPLTDAPRVKGRPGQHGTGMNEPTAPGRGRPGHTRATEEDELVPELSAMVEQVMRRYPLVRMFVRPETRPALMLIGGGLILTAIVLLGAPAARRVPTPAKTARALRNAAEDG